MNNNDITSLEHLVRSDRPIQRSPHDGAVVWFTGLSGAGKSTLAVALEAELTKTGYSSYVLDGDILRHGLNRDLGYSAIDRAENVRRVSEVAALFANAGFICIAALISPYRCDRVNARRAFPKAFHEIYIDTSLASCETRDPKGLYALARAGDLKNFTGIDSPYEPPESPDLAIDTYQKSVADCIETIIGHLFGVNTMANT